MEKTPVLNVGIKKKEDQSPSGEGEKKDEKSFSPGKITERGPDSAQGQKGDKSLFDRALCQLSCDVEFQDEQAEKREKQKKKRIFPECHHNHIIHNCIILFSGISSS